MDLKSDQKILLLLERLANYSPEIIPSLETDDNKDNKNMQQNNKNNNQHTFCTFDSLIIIFISVLFARNKFEKNFLFRSDYLCNEFIFFC